MPQDPEKRTGRGTPPAPCLDTAVPVVVFKTGHNPIHHGTLGIVRSLGCLGVPVYAVVEDRFTPVSVSRYLTGCIVSEPFGANAGKLVDRLLAIGGQLGRPAVLLPTDDVGATLIAENSGALAQSFLFPELPGNLPRLLCDRRQLHRLCGMAGVPSPEITLPCCAEEVEEFAGSAIFPVVVKADARSIAKGFRSVSIVRTPAELLSLHKTAPFPDSLVFQEYIPDDCAEDWIFHGYCNPQTGCFVSFTGRKLRSWPPFAGPTALGVATANPVLREQAIRLLKVIDYAGIVDLDYRLDKRDGQYKLLDFNPRIGANFRMSENLAGVDVARALHLDLTGRRVPEAGQVEGRRFILESQDWLASLASAARGDLTFRGWIASMRGPREFAWMCTNDPAPAVLMGIRLLGRTVSRTLDAGWSRLGVPPRKRTIAEPARRAPARSPQSSVQAQ